jgi:hypothetical protein
MAALGLVAGIPGGPMIMLCGLLIRAAYVAPHGH